MLHLIGSTNQDGYFSALYKTWDLLGAESQATPAKSSLSEFRDRVSFRFFENIYRDDLLRLQADRRRFRGFYVYAIDGDQNDLPLSGELLKHGYRGYRSRGNQETHFPKMYTVQSYDVLNGLVRDFRYSTKQSELPCARDMAGSFERKSICLYDRYYACYELAYAHTQAKNHYIIRVRGGKTTKREIRKFIQSPDRDRSFTWYALNQKLTKPGLPVRLVKVKNPRTNEWLVFMTNLSPKRFSGRDIAKLYTRRWEIENSFRDLTATLKLEQWHSKKLNGVLQEIYALLWLVNAIKFQCLRLQTKSRDWLDSEYLSANFKLCVTLVMDNLLLLLQRKENELMRLLTFWISRTQERRKHMSRNYPRAVRKRGRPYWGANAVPRRN